MAGTYELAVKPWESSSDVFTEGARALGLTEDFHFEDVLELEGQLPGGTVAWILTYITPADYETQKARDASLLDAIAASRNHKSDVVWLPQRVQNACGPHALFHAVFNSNCRHHLAQQSLLDQLQQRLTKVSSFEERSIALGDFSDLWEMCSRIGEKGSTLPPEDAEEDVEPHFVCFAGMGGNLASFDGDRTSGLEDLNITLFPEGLLPDQALSAVQRHLDRYADEDRRDFSTLLALVKGAASENISHGVC